MIPDEQTTFLKMTVVAADLTSISTANNPPKWIKFQHINTNCFNCELKRTTQVTPALLRLVLRAENWEFAASWAINSREINNTNITSTRKCAFRKDGNRPNCFCVNTAKNNRLPISRKFEACFLKPHVCYF